MTEYKYRVQEVKRPPKNRPWYQMQIVRFRDDSPTNPGK